MHSIVVINLTAKIEFLILYNLSVDMGYVLLRKSQIYACRLVITLNEFLVCTQTIKYGQTRHKGAGVDCDLNCHDIIMANFSYSSETSIIITLLIPNYTLKLCSHGQDDRAHRT